MLQTSQRGSYFVISDNRMHINIFNVHMKGKAAIKSLRNFQVTICDTQLSQEINQV